MARSSKTPKKDYFNKSTLCFGHFQQHDLKLHDFIYTSKRLILEIGCGKADFGLEVARLNPDAVILGVDLKSDRMYRAAKTATEEKLDNIFFLQVDTLILRDYIKIKSVNEIWLTFADPYPKDRHAKHRMTSKNFLKLYANLLKNDGNFYFKTDSNRFFNWSLQQIENSKYFVVIDSTNDLHAEAGHKTAKILTSFEKRFISEGLKINYFQTQKT